MLSRFDFRFSQKNISPLVGLGGIKAGLKPDGRIAGPKILGACA